MHSAAFSRQIVTEGPLSCAPGGLFNFPFASGGSQSAAATPARLAHPRRRAPVRRRPSCRPCTAAATATARPPRTASRPRPQSPRRRPRRPRRPRTTSARRPPAGAPGAGPAPGGAALTAAQLAPRKTASGEACRLPVVYQCGPLPICSAEGVVTCCTLCERLSARAFWAALRCAGSGMWSTSTQEQRCGVSAAR